MKTAALIVFAAGWLLASCSRGEPDIDVVTEYDLGTVTKGAEAVADLPVRNLGGAPLTVLAVSTSCGCTTATLSAETIAPGGDATLHVVYDSGAHEEDIGRIERHVFISSNDPDEADVRIVLTVLIEPSPS